MRKKKKATERKVILRPTPNVYIPYKLFGAVCDTLRLAFIYDWELLEAIKKAAKQNKVSSEYFTKILDIIRRLDNEGVIEVKEG